MKGGSTKLVRDIVREYAGNLGSQEGGEEEGGDRRRAETEHLLSLVDKFWMMTLWRGIGDPSNPVALIN